ncbi:MAG TPA: glucosamine-6-phosphate deaminase [Halanaerobiales bacterium]|nr:glucosamine-6-phosphate deaminase [Halanaerobiales bacterium]
MRVLIEKDYNEMSKKAAYLVKKQINDKPDSVLGLPTGSTPLKMYKVLIEMYRRGEVDFSEVTTFNLDEYYGLPFDHSQSYHYYMWNNFFDHINIKDENVHILDGMTENIDQERIEYETKIKNAGGINLQVLGIGPNGHIGFNEPSETLNDKTHLVTLTEETRESNSRFFDSKDEVPKKALTMGISTILKADKILIMASGEGKASAIKKTLSGQINTCTPSTLLQTHSNVTVVIDQGAAIYL